MYWHSKSAETIETIKRRTSWFSKVLDFILKIFLTNIFIFTKKMWGKKWVSSVCTKKKQQQQQQTFYVVYILKNNLFDFSSCRRNWIWEKHSSSTGNSFLITTLSSYFIPLFIYLFKLYLRSNCFIVHSHRGMYDFSTILPVNCNYTMLMYTFS